MYNSQYEYISTLQYRVKNLQAQIDAFKSGAKYQQMDAAYKSLLHTEEGRIKKLEFELAGKLRDEIRAISTLGTKQKIISSMMSAI